MQALQNNRHKFHQIRIENNAGIIGRFLDNQEAEHANKGMEQKNKEWSSI